MIRWRWGLAALAVAACAGSPPPRAHALDIRGFAFLPDTITVPVGDTLVWTNHDVVPHTATRAGEWDTGPVAASASGRWVATQPGTHDYICAFHPTMKGTVVVR